MQLVASALKGYRLDATDGGVGTVDDCLFDDKTWKVRWLVVATGSWLSGRKVLVHPSAILRIDIDRELLSVQLTKAQIKASPDVSVDEPVSRQMEGSLYDYYGAGPLWGGASYFDPFPYGASVEGLAPQAHGEAAVLDAPRGSRSNDGDRALRSTSAVSGYNIIATDGSIGHVENFILDDAGWNVLYLIVDTKNWWFGRHVLISPFAVRDIVWADREIRLDVSRERVRNSPAWDPAKLVEEAYQKDLHGYYGWRGYGW